MVHLTVKELKPLVRSRRLTIISIVIVLMIIVSYTTLIYFPKRNLSLAYATSDEKASSVDKAVVLANTKFALNLFKKLVEEDKILEAIKFCLINHRMLVEGAGAVGVAALINNPEEFYNRKVGLVISGGNIGQGLLKKVINN